MKQKETTLTRAIKERNDMEASGMRERYAPWTRHVNVHTGGTVEVVSYPHMIDSAQRRVPFVYARTRPGDPTSITRVACGSLVTVDEARAHGDMATCGCCSG